jgi:O-antigen ligase/polysaccharide polymerase Wzy-like membrane protein
MEPTAEYGLAASATNKVCAGLVVSALFLEKFERIGNDGTYPLLPIPDLIFLSAVALLAAKAAHGFRLGRIALRPFGVKDFALAGFVGLLVLLSAAAAITQPAEVTSDVQIVKTLSHLVVLLGVALLLGRVLSRALVEYSLVVFFVCAVAAGVLAVAQALDQSLFRVGLANALDLVSREGAEGFLQPCSIFSEPANLGYFSFGGLVLGVAFVTRRHRTLGLTGSAVCAAGLMLAAAVGPLAVAVPVTLYGLTLWRRLRVSAAAVAVAIGVAAVIWFSTPVSDTIDYRAEGISNTARQETGIQPEAPSKPQDASARLRTDLNRGSIDTWELAPFTGVGLGNTREHFSEVVVAGSSQAFNSANAYLNLLGEAGPVGVAGLVAVLFVLWWRNRRAPPRLDELTRAFVVILALEFLIINPLIMPPLWFWAGQRLALQGD